MNLGAAIAIGWWASVALIAGGLLLYGWIDEHLWERDQRRALRRLREDRWRALRQLRDAYETLPSAETARRAEVGFCSWLGVMAEQAREIEALPTIEPDRRWMV